MFRACVESSEVLISAIFSCQNWLINHGVTSKSRIRAEDPAEKFFVRAKLWSLRGACFFTMAPPLKLRPTGGLTISQI